MLEIAKIGHGVSTLEERRRFLRRQLQRAETSKKWMKLFQLRAIKWVLYFFDYCTNVKKGGLQNFGAVF